jgi:drug/metabolite transporter (DMT)-like permease
MLLIQCLSAPCAALIEWVWLRTPLTLAQAGCGITILIGVGIALSPSEHLNLTRRQLTVGGLFALIAALGGAFGAVLSRKAYALTHAHGETISGPDAAFQRILGGLLIGGICLLIVKRGWFRRHSSDKQLGGLEETRTKWVRVWPWVLANSVAGQTLGVSCMQRAFETTPTGIVLAIIATTPIVVIPLAYFFERERPTRRSLVGGLIAVCGVILLIRQKQPGMTVFHSDWLRARILSLLFAAGFLEIAQLAFL